jgi:two-component system sensor histidine kinase TctE
MRLPALPARRGSLTLRLLAVIVLPLSGLAILLGIGGALVIAGSVETVNDRILGATSQSIADSLAIDQGEISLALSPAIFGMLEDAERDNVYYNVRYGGHVLTGYSDLPSIAPRGLSDLQVKFADSAYRGKDIRVVAQGRRLPGLAEPIVVEVAETMDARRRSERRMLEGLALLEGMLVALILLLLPLAVRWGLRPLARLRAEMDQRLASDLTPLPDRDVPIELRDLVRGFNDLLGRFATLLQDTRRFTADASHQMRTPLSILRAHIAALRRAEPGGVEAAHSLDDIDQASERLQHLIVQLLALARADNAVGSGPELQPHDLNRLAEEVAADHAPAAVAADIELQFERAEAGVAACTHEVLAKELLGNLIDNAIRYGRPGGRVIVAVEGGRKGALISVEDDGPGIPEDQREAVFSRFSRLQRDSGRAGSGLGLPIARRIANAIGARLELATPGDGQGLRAEVIFPAATDRMMTG